MFLTHLGDLASWELSQQLNFYEPYMSRIKLVAIAPANKKNADMFCLKSNFNAENLYLDEEALSYKALKFEQGFSPDLKISPYLKLIPMLAGIQSEGTVAEILKGYISDRNKRAASLLQSA